MNMKVPKYPKPKKLGSTKRRTHQDSWDNGTRLNRSGMDGEQGIRVQPTFEIQTDREVINSPDNAAVIILDNNPKYASKGGDFASRISIVAGIQGHKLDEDKPIKDLTPKDDAAGIYVVQRDNPQDFFNPPLANPNRALHENLKNTSDKVKSHVTAYGDTIQIISNDGGVNIYACGASDKLSSGVPSDYGHGVNLIYGNKVEYSRSEDPHSLQPLVKGHNLELALAEMMKNQRVLLNYLWDLDFGPAAVPVYGKAYKVMSLITQGINQTFAEINASVISEGGINSRWNKTN